MERIAIYWKWWIGKSTISTNISACFSMQWKKVLQVGCDPKRDSTKKLLQWKKIPTVLDLIKIKDDFDDIRELVTSWFNSIDCIESWWPIPWTGCAGRWIAKMFEIFDDVDLLNSNYDIVLFDVLWDVVCWGFASPLREWYWEKIFIVISEEIMSMYACNNICKAVLEYSNNWIYIWWIIVNARNNNINKDIIEKFVDKIWLNIIAYIPRSEVIACAEYKSMSLAEYDNNSDIIKIFYKLTEDILKVNNKNIKSPKPMDDDEFEDFFKAFEIIPNWI